MSIAIAVDRLYEGGWLPGDEMDLDRLSNGIRYPSVFEVKRQFANAGLKLVIKQNLIFKCNRATWSPIGELVDDGNLSDDCHGTVIGSCEREAAVYALAQLRKATVEIESATA